MTKWQIMDSVFNSVHFSRNFTTCAFFCFLSMHPFICRSILYHHYRIYSMKRPTSNYRSPWISAYPVRMPRISADELFRSKMALWHGCFKMKPMFRTSEHCGFFSTCHALKMWFELLRVKLYRYDLRGNINYFELAEGLSYRGFALSIVQAIEAKITLQVCLEEEVQGKSTLVGANGRFELSGVDCT